MIPLVEVPKSIAEYLEKYRELFKREKGEKIYGVKKLYDYVEGKMSRYQTVVTATIANRNIIDGIELIVQEPSYEREELNYLKMIYVGLGLYFIIFSQGN